jgi:chromosomal replication initiator protein
MLDGNAGSEKQRENRLMKSETPALDHFIPFWGPIAEHLKSELGANQFKYWIKPLRVISADKGGVVLAAGTCFERDKAQAYSDLLSRLIRQHRPAFGPVEFIVVPRQRIALEGENMVDQPPAPEPSLVPGSIPLSRNCTFETFVVGQANEIAVAEARRVAESDEPSANPLLLFGDTGLGKTHLMQAIVWRVLGRDPTKRILHITSEWFVGKFVAAIKGGETEAFKRLVRDVEVLCVDDLHMIAGKNATAEEFLHTFDALVDANKQLVLTADRSGQAE